MSVLRFSRQNSLRINKTSEKTLNFAKTHQIIGFRRVPRGEILGNFEGFEGLRVVRLRDEGDFVEERDFRAISLQIPHEIRVCGVDFLRGKVVFIRSLLIFEG